MSTAKLAALLAAAIAAGPVAHAAEKFPQRPVRLIVPYAPGGATDITARIVQNGLAELWGQPVIVDNRPGASGTIAVELAAKSPTDGYTLQVGNVSTNAINETTFSALKVKPSRDLTGVTNLIQLPHLWVASTSVPASNLKEFADYGRKLGGKVNFGSAGIGSYPHLDAVKLLRHMGVRATHVPYKGGAGQMIPAIMGNEIQFMFINLASSLPNIKAGRIKPLATTWPTRRPELPNVPTIAESGYPGFGTNAWNGLFAPAGIPKPLLKQIHADVLKVMDSSATKDGLSKAFMTPVVNKSPEEFQRFVLEEIKTWGKVVIDNNIKVE